MWTIAGCSPCTEVRSCLRYIIFISNTYIYIYIGQEYVQSQPKRTSAPDGGNAIAITHTCAAFLSVRRIRHFALSSAATSGNSPRCLYMCCPPSHFERRLPETCTLVKYHKLLSLGSRALHNNVQLTAAWYTAALASRRHSINSVSYCLCAD